jgi:hypothetical protein
MKSIKCELFQLPLVSICCSEAATELTPPDGVFLSICACRHNHLELLVVVIVAFKVNVNQHNLDDGRRVPINGPVIMKNTSSAWTFGETVRRAMTALALCVN